MFSDISSNFLEFRNSIQNFNKVGLEFQLILDKIRRNFNTRNLVKVS